RGPPAPAGARRPGRSSSGRRPRAPRRPRGGTRRGPSHRAQDRAVPCAQLDRHRGPHQASLHVFRQTV
ncbi:MAG: hypothetical protein AVDCRST_MAG83-3034, partial [uncultured Arthrobacter sp.]